jgi:hypothetical protein
MTILDLTKVLSPTTKARVLSELVAAVKADPVRSKDVIDFMTDLPLGKKAICKALCHLPEEHPLHQALIRHKDGLCIWFDRVFCRMQKAGTIHELLHVMHEEETKGLPATEFFKHLLVESRHTKVSSSMLQAAMTLNPDMTKVGKTLIARTVQRSQEFKELAEEYGWSSSKSDRAATIYVAASKGDIATLSKMSLTENELWRTFRMAARQNSLAALTFVYGSLAGPAPLDTFAVFMEHQYRWSRPDLATPADAIYRLQFSRMSKADKDAIVAKSQSDSDMRSYLASL